MEQTQKRRLNFITAPMVRDWRMGTLCGIEAILVAAAATISFFVRFPPEAAAQNLTVYWPVIPLSVGIRVTLFWMFGLYGWVWYYMGVKEVLKIVASVSAGSVALGAVALSATRFSFPETLLVVEWLIVMALVSSERLSIRLWREHKARQLSPVKSETKKRLLIVGAGDASDMIARELSSRPSLGYRLVGYTDDDPRKLGQTMHGATVLGTTADINSLVIQHNVDEIIVAIPSASGQSMRRIVNECQETRVTPKTLPALHELIDGKVTFSRLREVKAEDLLRREPYRPDLNGVASYIRGSRILITGAAGSIGSELCRQAATFDPANLIMFDIDENGLHEMGLEMRLQFPRLRTETVIGNVRSREKADAMMRLYHPHVVFHAAAHKHVPMMEANPDEAVLNNILGTKVWIDAADKHGVERFVLVSTDKAVNPTSVMGGTKSVACMMAQCKSRESQTKFLVVRFGNVLASKGSVVPLFKKQIAQGGPVMVTHPNMVRYFMTIDEAARLIIQAGALGKGGEVFVLDMGQPVKILDLARDMIRLSGLKEDEDIKIEFIGMRPGEKLYEEPLTQIEGATATRYERIFLANMEEVDTEKLYHGIDELERLAQNGDPHAIRRKLKEIVPTYQPEGQPC